MVNDHILAPRQDGAMYLTSYEHWTKTENAARNYLLGFCFENYQLFRPRCKGNRLYRV